MRCLFRVGGRALQPDLGAGQVILEGHWIEGRLQLHPRRLDHLSPPANTHTLFSRFGSNAVRTLPDVRLCGRSCQGLQRGISLITPRQRLGRARSGVVPRNR